MRGDLTCRLTLFARVPVCKVPATRSRSCRDAIEIVISHTGLGMLPTIRSRREDFATLRMAMGVPIVLSVRNLTKTYRTAGEPVVVLRGVNLSVAAGERVALTGESGSGKSTLLHLIAGLDRADGGEIRLADTPLTDLPDAGRAALRRDQLGLVFQQFNLIPSLDVEDNLVFQSRIAGRHDAKWHGELVERLGLGGLLKRYPEQLSGGQQQRVAIGRALAA